ncbi:hypothetical protein GO988_01080 [Hymenobacter sp. HMF4947]|uniref:Uncharacterized protein n=1 Tax=Hymenobacter ginkgonis TaxID=2682976 RepID=A0A7K1T9S9_9BACT|nr:hypothetical protein [Hymenobacter ginkgonis]MVN74911.1 hypothetical protein [Hymenobacter ginkgonis]
MTDHEIEFAKMARLAYRELTDQRPQWEQRSPAMVADFEQLNNFLQAFEEVSSREGTKSGKEYTDARDRAEHAAEAAAGRIVRGLRVLQVNSHNPALATVASYTPNALNPLHGEELLGALNAIASAAAGVAPLLANEGVTDEHLKTLDDAIALYTPLATLNNSTVKQGDGLRSTARQVVKGLRTVLQRLDARIDNLRDEIPGLAQRYDDARRTADSSYSAPTGQREGGDGSEGGIGREAAGNAFGPEAQPGS